MNKKIMLAAGLVAIASVAGTNAASTTKCSPVLSGFYIGIHGGYKGVKVKDDVKYKAGKLEGTRTWGQLTSTDAVPNPDEVKKWEDDLKQWDVISQFKAAYSVRDATIVTEEAPYGLFSKKRFKDELQVDVTDDMDIYGHGGADVANGPKIREFVQNKINAFLAALKHFGIDHDKDLKIERQADNNGLTWNAVTISYKDAEGKSVSNKPIIAARANAAGPLADGIQGLLNTLHPNDNDLIDNLDIALDYLDQIRNHAKYPSIVQAKAEIAKKPGEGAKDDELAFSKYSTDIETASKTINVSRHSGYFGGSFGVHHSFGGLYVGLDLFGSYDPNKVEVQKASDNASESHTAFKHVFIYGSAVGAQSADLTLKEKFRFGGTLPIGVTNGSCAFYVAPGVSYTQYELTQTPRGTDTAPISVRDTAAFEDEHLNTYIDKATIHATDADAVTESTGETKHSKSKAVFSVGLGTRCAVGPFVFIDFGASVDLPHTVEIDTPAYKTASLHDQGQFGSKHKLEISAIKAYFGVGINFNVFGG